MKKPVFWFWPHKKQPKEVAKLVGNYHQVFGSDAGKDVLEDILLQAGLLDITPADGPIAYNEGKRAVAHHIVNIMRLTPDDLAKLRNNLARLQAEFNQAYMEMDHDN